MSRNFRNKILYVAGPGRSGSTLLDMLLGQIAGFWSVGELRFIWKRAFRQNQLCGCGKSFRECDFWTEVVREAFGDFSNVNYEKFEEMRYSVEHRISNGFSIHVDSDLLAPYQKYIDAYREIYQAVRKISGCEYIVDSSKNVANGFMLSTIPDVDLFTIHLVRDSRAVAHSWHREKIRPEIPWERKFMSQRGILKSVSRWNSRNLLAHKLKHVSKQYARIRYEDLASRPKEILSDLMAGLRIEQASFDFIEDFQAQLKTSHTVSGNPVRFTREEITIQPDMKWQNKMHPSYIWMVTLFTWPFLLKYGYFSNV